MWLAVAACQPVCQMLQLMVAWRSLTAEPPPAGVQVPRPLWGPLAYWIAICSVLGYYVVTWATQHLAASQVPLPAALCPAAPTAHSLPLARGSGNETQSGVICVLMHAFGLLHGSMLHGSIPLKPSAQPTGCAALGKPEISRCR